MGRAWSLWHSIPVNSLDHLISMIPDANLREQISAELEARGVDLHSGMVTDVAGIRVGDIVETTSGHDRYEVVSIQRNPGRPLSAVLRPMELRDGTWHSQPDSGTVGFALSDLDVIED